MGTKFKIPPIGLLIIGLLLFTNCNKNQKKNNMDNAAFVRISMGYYPPEKEKLVEEMLSTIFKEKIMPEVKKLNGNLNFYAAIDKEKNAVSNVSIWKSEKDAKQMDDMKEMKEMAKEFIKIGVKFSEITNHEIVWQLP